MRIQFALTTDDPSAFFVFFVSFGQPAGRCRMKCRGESLTPCAKAVEGYRTPRREALSGAQWFRQVLNPHPDPLPGDRGEGVDCASPLALFPEGRIRGCHPRPGVRSSIEPKIRNSKFETISKSKRKKTIRPAPQEIAARQTPTGWAPEPVWQFPESQDRAGALKFCGSGRLPTRWRLVSCFGF
jgi:hypothetical protein